MLHPSRAVSLAYLCLGVLTSAWGTVTVGESVEYLADVLRVPGNNPSGFVDAGRHFPRMECFD